MSPWLEGSSREGGQAGETAVGVEVQRSHGQIDGQSAVMEEGTRAENRLLTAGLWPRIPASPSPRTFQRPRFGGGLLCA